MAKTPIDLDELWALQESEGRDARGRDLDVAVPTGEPEYGPYAAYRLVPRGEGPGEGWRTLTPHEVREATERAEEERER